MGAFTSRQNTRVEEVDNNSNNAYKYPPKSGLFKRNLNSLLICYNFFYITCSGYTFGIIHFIHCN